MNTKYSQDICEILFNKVTHLFYRSKLFSQFNKISMVNIWFDNNSGRCNQIFYIEDIAKESRSNSCAAQKRKRAQLGILIKFATRFSRLKPELILRETWSWVGHLPFSLSSCWLLLDHWAASRLWWIFTPNPTQSHHHIVGSHHCWIAARVDAT